uniref:AlNc14C53G4088 protein n=1 Tax=Albugo laibachii Nc14 TaxID=890382 RepID=F0WBP7_9STRA|nr:AlNc14C53G4088 [Albugo laibachii Nc14]CCA20531.1 AlNc14C97G5891 [Albugo laibachii Nc14]|eukprot:CCA20531.1 AlNc14C97G5891 [Albugo laibachii Nc14]
MEVLTVQQRLSSKRGGQLCEYRLIRRLGNGKSFIVYKAERISDTGTIALKKDCNYRCNGCSGTRQNTKGGPIIAVSSA